MLPLQVSSKCSQKTKKPQEGESGREKARRACRCQNLPVARRLYDYCRQYVGIPIIPEESNSAKQQAEAGSGWRLLELERPAEEEPFVN